MIVRQLFKTVCSLSPQYVHERRLSDMQVTGKSSFVRFGVKVVTKASKSSIVGFEGELLKVRLAAAPVDGKANDELISILAKALHVSRSAVTIRSGLASRRKLIEVENCSEQKLKQLLPQDQNEP